MLITNLTILAVELKKLIGGNCKAEMLSESTLTITPYGDYRINVTYTDDVCRVAIVAHYAIPLEDVADAASKLRGDDVIHVYTDRVHVHKTCVIPLEQFSSLSAAQLEHAAKDIVGTMKGL